MRQRLSSFLILAIAMAWVLSGSFGARAETLIVCPQGCSFSSIQDAVARAAPGDTILIRAGTYVENLVIVKQGLVLRGEDPTNVIVRARSTSGAVVLVRAPDVHINGLTLTGGARGIQAEFVQSGEVRACLISGNTTGVFLGSRASFRLIATQIRENGDGVEALGADRVELQENVITNNRGCGLKADERSALLGSNNAIFANGQNLCGSAQNRTDLFDQTPPPPPQNLRVTPSDWTNQGRFEITWDDPQDLAGIAAYYFKLSASPAGPTDGIRRGIAQKPLVLEDPPEGEQSVFVWLEDGMGNLSHLNAAHGTLRFDRTPPSGMLLINQGARQTTELRVRLMLQVQDAASGVAEMRFSNDGQAWSPWEPFAPEKANWDLSQFGGNADPGRKTVSAQVRDRAGNVGQLSAHIEYIRPPVAQFALTPQNPRPTQRVTFDASASSSPNGAITRYSWDFGDGSTQETNQPIIQHAYASEGRYVVRLTVTDVLGLTASAEREIVVQSYTLRVPQDFSTVEEAVAAAQPGDVVAISSGIYSVNLIVDKSVTLRGAGPQTLLQGQNLNQPVLTVQGEGTHVRLEQLRLTARPTASAVALLLRRGSIRATAVSFGNLGTAPALEIVDSPQATFEDVTITASSGAGLTFSGSGNLTLQNAKIVAGGAGLTFSSSGELVLARVNIESAGDGLTFSSGRSLTIEDVQITAGKTAVRLAGAAELALDLTDSTFVGGEAGLALQGTVRVTALGGKIAGGALGLDVGEEARLVMEGTEVESTGLNIRVSARARARLQQMKISGGMAGVFVRDSATLVLEGNIITDHALWGVFLPSPECLLTSALSGHTGSVYSVAFSPDGRLLASGSSDWTIRLWDVGTGQVVRTLSRHTDSVYSVAFSPDGRLLASGSWDRTIRLWDVGTGQVVRTLSGHTYSVSSVAFSPDGRLLASGSDDRTIRLWDVGTGQVVRTLSGHTYLVNSVAFSPDGRLLASGSSDRTIRLWDVGTGQLVRTLSGHTDWVRSVAFSPDGRLLASGSWDRTIRLWDVGTGQVVRTLSGHTYSVNSVAFNPDGRLLASGSWDQTIRLWNVAMGVELLGRIEELNPLFGPLAPFTGVLTGGGNAMERNGQRLPERALRAGQGDVCPADILFLAKPKGAGERFQ